jgi:hypothetical protein
MTPEKQAELEAKIKALETQVKGKAKKFTDDLNIPDDATPAQIKQILADFEEAIDKKINGVSTEIENKSASQKEADKKAKFDAAVAAFQKEHPKLFEKDNETFLGILDNLLHKEMSGGKEPEDALKAAYETLGKVSTWKEEAPKPKLGEKPTEEKPAEGEEEQTLQSFLTGSILSPTKTPAGVQKKGITSDKDAVASSLAELKAEGLTMPKFGD